MSGSELVQKFIGEGSRMVRELFVMAQEHAPSIIFMDEIDSIGSTRIESGDPLTLTPPASSSHLRICSTRKRSQRSKMMLRSCWS